MEISELEKELLENKTKLDALFVVLPMDLVDENYDVLKKAYLDANYKAFREYFGLCRNCKVEFEDLEEDMKIPAYIEALIEREREKFEKVRPIDDYIRFQERVKK